jgi:hypothetical protein
MTGQDIIRKASLTGGFRVLAMASPGMTSARASIHRHCDEGEQPREEQVAGENEHDDRHGTFE